MIGLVLVVLLLTAAVAFAGWTLITDPSSTGTAASPGTAAPTTVRVAPTPSQVTETKDPPRTIQASGMATIPETLLLPHETDTAWSGTNLSLDTCIDGEPERDIIDAATDIRTIYTQTESLERSETLVVAPDDSSANAMYDQLAQAMSNCTQPTNAALATPVTGRAPIKQLMDDGHHLATEWDRGAVYAAGFPAVEPSEPNQASYLLLARSGRALIIGSAQGSDIPLPTGDRLDPATAAMLQQFADAMAPQTCVFKAQGCGPFPTQSAPPQFPAGSIQLPDGTVMLPDGTILQANGLPLGATPTPDDAPQ